MRSSISQLQCYDCPSSSSYDLDKWLWVYGVHSFLNCPSSYNCTVYLQAQLIGRMQHYKLAEFPSKKTLVICKERVELLREIFGTKVSCTHLILFIIFICHIFFRKFNATCSALYFILTITQCGLVMLTYCPKTTQLDSQLSEDVSQVLEQHCNHHKNCQIA